MVWARVLVVAAVAWQCVAVKMPTDDFVLGMSVFSTIANTFSEKKGPQLEEVEALSVQADVEDMMDMAGHTPDHSGLATLQGYAGLWDTVSGWLFPRAHAPPRHHSPPHSHLQAMRTDPGEDNAKQDDDNGERENTSAEEHEGVEEQTLVQLGLGQVVVENETPCRAECHWRGSCVDGECECFPGFAGTLCEQDNRCPFNCNGRGMCDESTKTCHCMVGFAGDGCERVVSLCPQGCSGHGVCNPATRVCECSPGFEGTNCSVVVADTCPSQCSLHGSCLLGMCHCDHGFAGLACNVATSASCPSFCSGHGTCVNGTCECEDGFVGSDCSTAVALPTSGAYGCPDSCSGRGVCVRGECHCAYGWYGSRCSKSFGGCPNDCSGHGSCGAEQQCRCQVGYSGESCEVNEGGLCEDHCNAMGSCVASLWEFVGLPPSCECYNASLSTGSACNLPTTHIGDHCPNNCSGHGRCVNGRCQCDGEFGGVNCSRALFNCPRNCSGKGVCFFGQCSCVRGRGGADCSQVVPTCPNDCSLHGECHDGVCLCESEWTGSDCNTTCPHPTCSGHGTCNHGTCECEATHAGRACQMESGCPNDCNENGVCKDGVCQCSAGFAGEDCSFGDGEGVGANSRWECAHIANCSGHGVCRRPGDFSPDPQQGAHGEGQWRGVCECAEGWEGERCERAVVGFPRDTRCDDPEGADVAVVVRANATAA